MTPVDLEPVVARLRARIGRAFGPQVVAVERGAIVKFARALGERNPLYFDEAYARTTRFGGIIAPPTFVSCFGVELLQEAIVGDPALKRRLHASDLVEHCRPIVPGDVISTTVTYADVYAKGGRSGAMLFESVDVRLVNARAEAVALWRMVGVSL